MSKQPSSMCPAFGAIRNLLRMEDAMPIVISSRRRMPVRTHVRRAFLRREPADLLARRLARRSGPRARAFDELRGMVVRDGRRSTSPRSSRSVRCASRDTVGLPFDLLPKQIGNTEIVYVPLPAYSVHTHARAKDIVVDSLVWRLPPQRKARAGVNLIGEIFPSDPIKIDEVLRRIGTHVNTHVPGSALGRLRRDGRRRAQRAAASVLQRERQAHEDETGLALRRRRAGRHRRDLHAGSASIGEALKLNPAVVEAVAARRARHGAGRDGRLSAQRA